MYMETMTMGMIIGFICSVGFLALGYTLGTHSLKEDESENVKNKNEIIDELMRQLAEMKEARNDSTEAD